MLTPDDILQDRYRIVRRLSHGGMGAVYEAIDRRVKSTVAIKETFAMTEAGRRAFRHEAQRLANLEHEVFPKVFDHFEEGEGLYLVMQLVRGEDLAERLKERINYHEGPFSCVKALEWADQLLDALEMLHGYKPPIIHRDIKPSNLKLTQRGKIVLLDFGIAKGVAGLMSATDGSIKAASPNFSPLEQILRVDETTVETLLSISQELVEKILHKGTGPRSDLYALGATLYCLITGKLPVDSRIRAMAMWAGRPDPLHPASKFNPQVTDAVSKVLMQAMALDPDERIDDATTMRQSLREAVGAPAYKSPSITSLDESERRHKEEVRRRAEAVTERQLFEGEERQRPVDETSRGDAETQRERRAQDTTLLATEERHHREALERHRPEAEEQHQAEGASRASDEQGRKKDVRAQAEVRQHDVDERRVEAEWDEEEKRGETETQRPVISEAEGSQGKEELHRSNQDRMMSETKRVERNRESELEEDSTVEAQQTIATTQRTRESEGSDSLAMKTFDEGSLPTESGSAPLEAVRIVINKRVVLIGVIAIVALAVVVFVVLGRYGERNNNQSTNGDSSTGNATPQMRQEADTSMSATNSATVPPPVQSLTPPPGMTYIPGGEFRMGRDGDPTGYESPAHQVTVKSFYIDLYEVTREDYQKCVDEKKCRPPSVWGSSTFPDGTAKLPVTGVSWNDANAYARWVGKRLPTEEEWEFAARGGVKEFRYPWGNEWQDGLANANSVSNGLAEVGSYKGTSPFGVFDMVGNAWEWTASPLKAYLNGKSTITLDIRRHNALRVIRGCMYSCNKDQATATYRRGWPAYGNYDYTNTGFRCAKDETK